MAHVPGPRLVLRSTGVIVGPPLGEAQGIQIGQQKKTRQGLEIRFGYLNSFTPPQEKWVYCGYGVGGDVQLLRRVPDDTALCVADIKLNGADVGRISMTCQP